MAGITLHTLSHGRLRRNNSETVLTLHQVDNPREISLGVGKGATSKDAIHDHRVAHDYVLTRIQKVQENILGDYSQWTSQTFFTERASLILSYLSSMRPDSLSFPGHTSF